MLIGAKSLACGGGGAASYPGRDASFDLQDGYIPYSSLIVDQRIRRQELPLIIRLTGAAGSMRRMAPTSRCLTASRRIGFITTPRDLATHAFRRRLI